MRESGFPKVEKKECLLCHEIFLPDRRRQKWCSRECFDQYANSLDHGWAWKGGRATCSICGNSMSYTLGQSIAKDSPICMKCRGQGFNPWGKEHPNYNGYSVKGIGGERSETYKKHLLKRDEYKCINCGNENVNVLQACHIIPCSEKPELALELENGVTLCANCHLLFDKGFIDYDYPFGKGVD